MYRAHTEEQTTKNTGKKKTLIPRHSQNASKHNYTSETAPEAEDKTS
jgi:hypothetical protein